MSVPTRADEALQIKPLTGFGSREALFAELREATGPDAQPSVLAVFGLDGISEYGELFGQLDADTLIVGLAGRLEEILRSVATFYQPRKGEFVVLCQGDVAAVEPLLEQAAATLQEPGRFISVTGAYGMTVLPSESSDPVEALMLADQQLSALLSRRSRERRSGERRLNPR